MPVQMVCDSTSLVSAALRDTLTSSSTSLSSSSGIGGASSVSTASFATSDNGPRTSSLFGAGSTANSSGFLEPEEEFDRIENDLTIAIKRNQLRPIRYEEVPNYTNELDSIKSKYTVLKPTASSNGINGSNSIGGAGMTNGSTTNTSGLLMNGGSNSTMTTKAATADSISNGPCGGGSSSNQQNGGTSTNGKDQLPTPKRVLFARENIKLGWKASGRKWTVGAGMINVGNTCYLNSTLQALFHVPAIANWLISDTTHRERCDDNGQGSCIICAMAKTLLASQSSNQGAIKPYLVYSKLRLVCKHLVPGRQEDAHEFLRYLVEAMEKSYLSRIKNSKDLDQYSKETTPLNQILGGYLRSEVKCLSCQHISTTFQHFEDLLLDIRKANSIEEALSVYFARERLEEMQYKCEACKKRVAATKQFYLERAPFALCIQLKRFSMLGGKINKHVELRGRLDLTPYAKSATSNVKLTYKLVSMVTHLGNTQHCGHYTAIGGTENGTYYVFDDSSVRPISIQNVTSTNAYIIFYELESVQNGVKTNVSSTATLASCATATGSSSGKIGSSSGTGAGASGASANSSPLRIPGSSGNSGHNPLFPSKLENRPGFIGPVLPQQTPEKTKKLVNGLTSHQFTEDEGEPMITSTSSRLSPISSTTSSLSSPSPVKQSGSGSLSSPSGSKLVKTPLSQSPSSMKNKFGMIITSTNVPNGIGNTSSSNGSFKSSSTSSQSSASSLLPSMPKLCNSPAAAKSTTSEADKFSGAMSGEVASTSTSSSAAKGAGFHGCSPSSSSSHFGNNKNIANGHNSKAVSLVPYDADDDDDDDDDTTGDPSKRHSRGRTQNNDGSDEDGERLHSHGPGNKKLSTPAEEDLSSSPKSPPVIKTTAGLWKVSDNRQQTSSSSSANSSKSASPATSGNSSPASYGLPNGSTSGPLASGYETNSRRSNGYNNNGNNPNRSGDVVGYFRKYSHCGYGGPASSWDGQQSNMEREVANEKREERKRQLEDDRETEMDRGRMKKMKPYFNQRDSNGPQQNAFQAQQNYQMNNNRKWMNNGNGFGCGNKYMGRGGGGNRFQNRNPHYYQNGDHPRNHTGFRGGRNARNAFYHKSYRHHQRDNGGGGGFHSR